MTSGATVKLTQRYLGAIERLNPKINAMLTVTPNTALEEVDVADRAINDGECSVFSTAYP